MCVSAFGHCGQTTRRTGLRVKDDEIEEVFKGPYGRCSAD